jgi:hypothetical protein
MNIKFLNRLLKRIDIPASVFSSAWKEGIIDTFKEMGWLSSYINGCNILKKAGREMLPADW